MLIETDCDHCAGSGNLCSGCCAPAQWCDCPQDEVAPLRADLREMLFCGVRCGITRARKRWLIFHRISICQL